MNSNMIYRGRVTVKVKNKPPVKTKNAGTTAFFKILYSILSQALLTENQTEVAKLLPSYITMIYEDDYTLSLLQAPDAVYKEDAFVNALLAPIPITSRRSSTKDTVYECILNYGNIKYHSYSPTMKGYVLLLNGESENKILAYTPFEFSVIQPVVDDPLGQATIQWSLSFSNAPEEEL